MPYRKIKINIKEALEFLIVPGTLLYVIEQIIKTTIVSTKVDLEISLELIENSFVIRYLTEDKIVTVFTDDNIKDLTRVYSIYSSEPVMVSEIDNERFIRIPILKIKQ